MSELSMEPARPPLRRDSDGSFRVGDSRVTLDTVVELYLRGAIPEAIALQFPTLKLADLYGVISYYLSQPAAVETYLLERKQECMRVKEENERRFAPEGIRKRLLERERQ